MGNPFASNPFASVSSPFAAAPSQWPLPLPMQLGFVRNRPQPQEFDIATTPEPVSAPVTGATSKSSPPMPKLGVTTWERRAEHVAETLAQAVPKAGQLAIADVANQTTPHLANFIELPNLRQHQQALRAMNRHLRPTHNAWAHLAEQPKQSMRSATQHDLSTETALQMLAVHTQAATTEVRMEEQRATRQQRAAQRIQQMRASAVPTPVSTRNTPTSAQDGGDPGRENLTVCGICMEDLEHDEWMVELLCTHHYHKDCLDQWVAHQSSAEDDVMGSTCPACRQPIEIVNLAQVLLNSGPTQAAPTTPRASETSASHAPPEHLLGTPQSHYDWVSASSIQHSPQSPTVTATEITETEGSDMSYSQFPWWPAPAAGDETEAVYHSRTKLPHGQLSMLVDPGAWTNLIGENLARQLVERAIQNGHSPHQTQMAKPLCIQGVGHGTQECKWSMTTPVAVADHEGVVRLHTLTAPIVSGAGADLPGLLGLKSLEGLRAVMDMGNHQLILPGSGDAQIVWPAGTIKIPLQKAPSGHLVMVVDEFERALKTRDSAVPPRTVALHSAIEEPATTIATASAAPTGAPAMATPPAVPDVPMEPEAQ